MEAYIDGMSRMRRLEDTQPEYEKAALDEFFDIFDEKRGYIVRTEKQTSDCGKQNVFRKTGD